MTRERDLPRIDGRFVRSRRLELGLSEGGLARSLGVAPTTLRHIEGDERPANYDLAFLARLARALEVEFIELFTGAVEVSGADVEADDGDTASLVGAVLAGSGGRAHLDALAESLGWTLEYTRLALDELAARVAGAGIRLVWIADTEVMFGPRAGVTATAGQYLSRALEVTGLNAAEFEVVAQLARSGPLIHRSTGDNGTVTRLVTAGLVQVERTGKVGANGRRRTEMRLTDETLFDLVLR